MKYPESKNSNNRSLNSNFDQLRLKFNVYNNSDKKIDRDDDKKNQRRATSSKNHGNSFSGIKYYERSTKFQNRANSIEKEREISNNNQDHIFEQQNFPIRRIFDKEVTNFLKTLRSIIIMIIIIMITKISDIKK